MSREPRQDDSRPSREEAFDAFCLLVAYASGHSAAPQTYDQRHLPPDVSSEDSYKRRHRALRAAGIPGAWTRSKTLACTPAAWAAELAKPKRPPKLVIVPPPAPDLAAEAARALGIKWTR